eukprot:CAMPEP_0173329798 /NCGR_PEP_ID=MMETSP1144-20121109/2904_1 /TAXON_ID=483371 /ORGANISM="non described non described, Strain CCMP2298" /LENGTH=336 /DNA_ID=CAMNT_0014274425 /DNA_START=382 /DNA_END=1389 /DNA_ORIENTATION=+
MRANLEQKVTRLGIALTLNDGISAISGEENHHRRTAAKGQQITKAREYYAASKVQALVTGYLDRLICKRKRAYLRTIQLLQRIMQGKLGRIRWKREYYRSVSVVKSDKALQEIIQRSSLLREAKIAGKGGYCWFEYFDPLSDSFWYYNSATKLNTWQVPLVFQKGLVCSWEGFKEFGGALTSTSSTVHGPNNHTSACRATFDTMDAYRNHLRLEHAWYCISCHTKNPGLCFPLCGLCGNTYSEGGVSGEIALRDAAHEVRRTLERFLYKDAPATDGLYSLKGRLLQLAEERAGAMQQMAVLRSDLAYLEERAGAMQQMAVLRSDLAYLEERAGAMQ